MAPLSSIYERGDATGGDGEAKRFQGFADRELEQRVADSFADEAARRGLIGQGRSN